MYNFINRPHAGLAKILLQARRAHLFTHNNCLWTPRGGWAYRVRSIIICFCMCTNAAPHTVHFKQNNIFLNSHFHCSIIIFFLFTIVWISKKKIPRGKNGKFILYIRNLLFVLSVRYDYILYALYFKWVGKIINIRDCSECAGVPSFSDSSFVLNWENTFGDCCMIVCLRILYICSYTINKWYLYISYIYE